jgi:hypothetical protein
VAPRTRPCWTRLPPLAAARSSRWNADPVDGTPVRGGRALGTRTRPLFWAERLAARDCHGGEVLGPPDGSESFNGSSGEVRGRSGPLTAPRQA